MVAYVCCSGAVSQEIRAHHIFYNVLYAYIDIAYEIVFSERLHVAQHALHRVCGRRFVSHNHSRGVSVFVQLKCQSWQVVLAVSPKRVAYVQWFSSALHAILVS